ncbi:MAG: hypothetical protein A2Y90_04365 [Chloroflexi bacterium RBG_13_52_12]|nr:MAG: hypothetical protein A2Y90_04365 [Chloroflexi bacterium RBG_13_52_12]
MKRILYVIALLTVSILLQAAGISCSTDKITAVSGQEFTLPAGRTAVISGENLSIKFVEVEGDSRCARGVECIQAGEAKCRMLITYKASTSEIIITHPGGDASSLGLLGNFKVSYKLEPYPEYGKEIAPADYKLVMTVTK